MKNSGNYILYAILIFKVPVKLQQFSHWMIKLLQFDRYLNSKYFLQKREHTHLWLVRRGGLASNEYVYFIVSNIDIYGTGQIATV